MNCERCGKNKATIKLVKNINGVEETHYLCAKCANEMNLKSLESSMMNSIFSPFFNSKPQYREQVTCKDCGTSLDEFISSGFLGCPSCYENLREYIEPSIRNVQKGTYHLGKRPLNFGNLEVKMPKDRKLELTEKLHQLVKEERYEEAARVRDEIKRLGE